MTRMQRRQSGATLVVTLIFLAVFLILTIAIINSSVVNTKVAANQQHTVEARNAAQQGIEQVISQNFTINPAAAAANVPVDVNGDGTTDYVAQVSTPVCETSKQVMNTELDVTNADDISCFVGNGNQNTGLLTGSGGSGGSGGGGSLCAATQWDVQANVNDSAGTAANVTLHQGVAVRVLAGTPCP